MGSSELIVHNTVYFQSPHSQPSGIVHRYNRTLLGTDPPAVTPILLLGRDWTPLPTSHISPGDVGSVILRNDDGVFRDRLPSVDELADAARRTIRVSLRGDGVTDLEIPPGESQMITPKNSLIVRLSSGSDRTQCWVMVLSR